MKTYDELNLKSKKELEDLKTAELERISSNENHRQNLIKAILMLQNIESNFDMRER